MREPGSRLQPDVPGAERPQADADRLGRVDLGVGQRGQEFHAAPVHRADRLVIVQADVEVPLVGLGEAAQDEHVVAPGHDEEEAPIRVRVVVRDAMRLRQPGHGAAVVLMRMIAPRSGDIGSSASSPAPRPEQLTIASAPYCARQRLLLSAQRADDLALDDVQPAARTRSSSQPMYTSVSIIGARCV